MIAIIDYGAGNLFSVKNALEYLGLESVITNRIEDLKNADKLILPGVGAFPDAMEMLRKSNLVPTILEEAKKKPLLGICLGMQILFERGFEFHEEQGLGLIPGDVTRLSDTPGLKIPHIGWSDVKKKNDCALTYNLNDGDRFYFVHSFKAKTADEYISLYTDYGEVVPGLVFRGNVYGAQFHPEKSGTLGLKILENFGGIKA